LFWILAPDHSTGIAENLEKSRQKTKFKTMKKLSVLIIPVLVIFISAWSKKINPDHTERINLSSNLTMQSAVVVESGCNSLINATIEITNPAESQDMAEFRLGLKIGTSPLSFKVIEIDNRISTSQNPLQYFKVASGLSKKVKVQFQIGGSNFMFNKAYLFTGSIYPRRYNGTNFSFYDDDKSNDILTKEVFIGSANALCFKCIETENVQAGIEYAFFIPGFEYNFHNCIKYAGYLSSPLPELKIPANKAENAKVYFEFISNGVIANTTVKKVLIRNKEGKFLTFNNNVPKFMARIENDPHQYQDWVILKGTSTGSTCSRDREYKLVQYIDNNQCYELYQLKVSGTYTLFYRTGIREEKKGERIIIAPRFQKEGGEQTN
jgi:hypothetical protein